MLPIKFVLKLFKNILLKNALKRLVNNTFFIRLSNSHFSWHPINECLLEPEISISSKTNPKAILSSKSSHELYNSKRF